MKELLNLDQALLSTDENVFQESKNVLKVNKVQWAKLDIVCTNGAPCMVGRLKGFVTLHENYSGRNVFKYHFFIHRETLYTKDLLM